VGLAVYIIKEGESEELEERESISSQKLFSSKSLAHESS